MRTALILLAPVLMLGLLAAVYRALVMARGWRPAAALVWRTDYTEAEQFDDRWGFGGLRGWRWGDGDNSRAIDEELHFQDESGVRYVTERRTQVRRGRRPDANAIIWYDVADPHRTSQSGPFAWLALALLLGAGLALLLALGPALAR